MKKLKIGCFTYDIISAKIKSPSNHGETNTDTKQILLSDTDNQQVVKETLLHEVLHALLEDAVILNLFTDDDHEERLVRYLSPKLMAVMQDNPKLVDYLWKKSK
jgi:hypothetical protein